MVTKTCTACSKSITLADNMLGKLVRCPHCLVTMIFRHESDKNNRQEDPTSEPVQSISLSPIDTLESREISIRVIDPAWQVVRSSLQAIFLCLILLCIFSGAAVAVYARYGLVSTHVGVGNLLQSLISIIIVYFVILGIAVPNSLANAVNTPAEAGARAYLVGCTWCVIAIYLIGCVGVAGFSSENTRSQIVAIALAVLLLFLGGSAFLLFILYLKALAVHFKSPQLVENCRLFLLTFFVGSLCWGGLTLLIWNLHQQGAAIFGVPPDTTTYLYVIGSGSFTTFAFCWVAQLVRRTRDIIDQELAITPTRQSP